MKQALPIDAHVEEIRGHLATHRAVVVTAPPGAGKTTRVPPALAADGAVVVLQPRRLAARSLAAWIARDTGWTLGEEVGWQVRFERNFTAQTRVLVATEGVLTARLQSDPLLEGFRTIVLDEFHERSIHADLALALARQAWMARNDLRIVVMSATLDAAPVARFLNDAPVVAVDTRRHPVEIAYAPGVPVEDAVAAEASRGGGHLLVFLPGAPEIHRLAVRLSGRPAVGSARVLPLHGRLPAEAQDAAIAPSSDRKIVLATNVAETSITVEGVATVVDTGLHRVPRFDVGLGIDRLVTERVSRDAADQRAGRAGRTAPGRALRLWDPRDELRPHRQPEIERIDLSAPLLEVLAWGAAVDAFPWFEAPPQERVLQAQRILRALGALEGDRITPLGETLRRLPLPPRLARVLLAAEGSDLAFAVCAVLGERFEPAGPLPAGPSDAIARADRLRDAPRHVIRATEEIAAAYRRHGHPSRGGDDEQRVLRALLQGFPDRLARRREPGSRRLVLASGHGAVLDPLSVVHDGEFLLALDVEGAPRGPGAEARVRMASRVDPAWLPAPELCTEHRFDASAGRVRAFEVARVGGLALSERPVPPVPVQAEALLVEAFVARGITPDQAEVAARLRFAGFEPDLRRTAVRACAGTTVLPPLDLWSCLAPDTRRSIERLAPATLPLPSGRSARLAYRADGSVLASVKLQEMFGLARSPRVGPRGEPVTIELLAPNGRAVQTTRDLASFWETTYPEVRRALRGRYPRHPWPEDPWTAPPTHRVKPR